MPLRKITKFAKPMPQSVLGRAEGQRSPNNVTIDDIRYTSRVFPPGLFAGYAPNSGTTGMYRFLPRTRVVSVTGTEMIVSPFTARIFIPGDVLTLITATGTAGASVGTVTAVDAELDKLTFAAASTATVGASIGDATITPVKPNGDRLGMISPNTPIYLDEFIKYGAFLGCTPFRGLMPYLDQQLETLFPLINYV